MSPGCPCIATPLERCVAVCGWICMFTPSEPVDRARDQGFELAMGMSPGHPRPPVPWLLAPLLIVAGAAGPQPQQVNGVLGGSALLSPALPPNKTVREIEWSFSTGAGATIQVAEFRSGTFERPDPKDRFKDRLEMLNETALKIRALERGDSGVYGARIKLHPALVEDQIFNLSVYEPVPAPEIQHRLLSLTDQGCNITLRCWVLAGSGAEAAWQLGSSLGTLWGHLCEDNGTLCLAVPASAFASSYTCVARNPIEERSVSIRLDTLCRQQGKKLSPPAPGATRPAGSWHPPRLVPAETHRWWMWQLCLVLLLAAGALLGIVQLWRKKRRKKAAEGGGRCRLKAEALGKEPGKRKPAFSFAVVLPALPGPGRLHPPFPAPRFPPAPLRSSPPAPLTVAALSFLPGEDAPVEPRYTRIQRRPPPGDGGVARPPHHHLQPGAGKRGQPVRGAHLAHCHCRTGTTEPP
ncbi:uncharacterized protein LOC116961844 isoform X3 [Tyto alba]|uniref:uncharacterized protein LOC116961844 isoform X3 n=1 Tax=Tyto alba TaxID=56313 RepID=UPI001C669875|nr:uncharacterized protein LOC116961844 isoform X3 [Tyto alba]